VRFDHWPAMPESLGSANASSRCSVWGASETGRQSSTRLPAGTLVVFVFGIAPAVFVAAHSHTRTASLCR
jgi:hypothetical protein